MKIRSQFCDSGVACAQDALAQRDLTVTAKDDEASVCNLVSIAICLISSDVYNKKGPHNVRPFLL